MTRSIPEEGVIRNFDSYQAAATFAKQCFPEQGSGSQSFIIPPEDIPPVDPTRLHDPEYMIDMAKRQAGSMWDVYTGPVPYPPSDVPFRFGYSAEEAAPELGGCTEATIRALLERVADLAPIIFSEFGSGHFRFVVSVPKEDMGPIKAIVDDFYVKHARGEPEV